MERSVISCTPVAGGCEQLLGEIAFRGRRAEQRIVLGAFDGINWSER